jgi:hypothetical protein
LALKKIRHLPSGRCDLKKLLIVVALLLDLPRAGLSQAVPPVPRVALFGGFTRVFDRADPNSFYVGSFHFDGGQASAEVKLTRWAGIVGDYGWQWSLRDGQVTQRIALIGPQFSPHAIHHALIPLAHVLVGDVHGTIDYDNRTAPPAVSEGSVFATAVGGGLDIKLGRHFWFRAVQAEWLHADLSPDHHTTARISTGIVLRL